jgi:hypothetical protein
MKAAHPFEMYFSTWQYFITSQETNENTHSCENSKCHATKYYKIITVPNFDELCEHCEPYLMFDWNTSQQPTNIIKAAYSPEMLVHCYQPTKCHISENSDFLYLHCNDIKL